jgi:DNA-3-methyladenine glycosylase II
MNAAASRRLTEDSFLHALGELSSRDSDLGAVLSNHGTPPFWSRDPGFPTLVHIILEQQVSLASAQAAFDRVGAAVGELVPEKFLDLDDGDLKAAGFSRQKTRYCRILARELLEGSLDLDHVQAMPDDEAREELMRITGIGRWTADIYLLAALKRPDIWPVGDLALDVALHRVKGLEGRPTREEFERMGNAWRPWRAVAARILWHHYLSGSGG